MSPKSTSLIPPSEVMLENPMPRACAQSSTDVTIAPDCVTKARLPRWGELRERGVEADRRRHDAHAIRPDDTQQMRLSGLQHLQLQRLAGRPQLAESGTDHHHAARAPRAELRHQPRHRIGRRADHREVRRHRQARDILVGQNALDQIMLRVDRHHRPFEARLEQVARHHRAHRLRALAGADQGDRPGLEHRFRIADRHGVTRPR